MRVAIPHSLDKAEVRRRLESRSGELAGFIPGGIAELETDWIGEDHMALGLKAMGQFIGADLTIEEKRVVVEIDLPAQLSFVGGMIENGIREKGTKLLT